MGFLDFNNMNNNFGNNGGFGNFAGGNNNGGYGQPVVRVQPFNFNHDLNKEKLYVDAITTLMSNKLRDSTDNHVKVSDAYKCTMRGRDISLTFELNFDATYRALQMFVYSSDLSRGNLGDVIDQPFFDRESTITSFIYNMIKRTSNMSLNLGGNNSSVVAQLFQNFMNDLSDFGTAVGNYIAQYISADNMGNIIIPNELQYIMNQGFQFAGIVIAPTVSAQGIQFNYTFSESFTNSQKQDQRYFK